MSKKNIYIGLGIIILLVIVVYALRSPQTESLKIDLSGEYGYKIQYPSDWQVEVSVAPRNRQSIPEWIKNNLSDYKKIKEITTSRYKITLLENDANIIAVFPHADWVNNNNIISVTYAPKTKTGLIPVANAESVEDKIKNMEQVLDGFEFVEDQRIAVISPTPGQIWTAGETYEIRWKPSNPQKKIGIQLYDTAFLYADNPMSRSASLAKVWTKTMQDTGNYKFTMPLGITLGSDGVFQIYVSTAVDNYGYSPLIAVTSAEKKFAKPMIEEITGPTEVPVNEQATWFVRARDPQGGVLSDYTVSWGDGSACTLVSCGPQDKSDFSHSFVNSGTYEVKFGVSNAQGLREFKTIEITVIGEPTIK